MAVLWGIVFSQAMHSVTLGVCMGLAMGTAFGLFDSGRGENEDEERRRIKMKELIAYCGLDCESCEARTATVRNDDALRKKVAALWSELNGVEITSEMINCVGCRIDGAKTPYCESLCPIRQCALGKTLETCGSCAEHRTCEKLGMILKNNGEARRNLGV